MPGIGNYKKGKKFELKSGNNPSFKELTSVVSLDQIHENTYQKKKEEQISTLISELKPLIQDIGDATLVVPLLKEYLEISVKNDEQLIKMATIIQRAVQNDGNDDDNFGTK